MAQTKIIPGYPALMIEGDKKSLVITDLHLGFENALSLNNVFLGKNKTVTEITKEIENRIKERVLKDKEEKETKKIIAPNKKNEKEVVKK